MGEISEQQLEQYIVDHPGALKGDGAKVIGRQVPLPHGRLDLLIYRDGFTYVVELKARPLKERDIGQVCRYQSDIVQVMQAIGLREAWDSILNNEESPPGREMHDTFIEWATNWNIDSRGIRPYLVGPAVTEKVAAAAWGAGVGLIIWRAEPLPIFTAVKRPEPMFNIPHEFPWWAEDLCDEIVVSAWHNQKIYEDMDGEQE